MSPQSKARSKPKSISLEQYFEMEMTADTRHEFWNGEVRAMAYTSPEHGIIVHNLDRLIGNCIVDRDCILVPNDRMLYVPDCNKIYYPDLVLVCGKSEYHVYKGKMVATLNPKVIIEVLSDSTKDDDKVGKWDCYKRIASLEQYVLVYQDRKRIEAFQRTEDDKKWLQQIFFETEENITIGDCVLSLKDIYHKVF
jgi:Uma2 family endonuclease